MAEHGEFPGNMECMRQTLREHGVRALYLNFRFRVAVIAGWTAVLSVTDPFASWASV